MLPDCIPNVKSIQFGTIQTSSCKARNQRRKPIADMYEFLVDGTLYFGW